MRYTAEKYAGRVYCGNIECETLDEVYGFANDGFCDRAEVYDGKSGTKLMTIKIKEA